MYEIFVQLMNQKGVTPYAVSKATGLTQSTLSSWKTRGTTPRRGTLKLIADYFGVTLAYLMGESSDRGMGKFAAENGGGNVICIASRDGNVMERHLTDKQLEALKAILSQLPEPGDDI